MGWRDLESRRVTGRVEDFASVPLGAAPSGLGGAEPFWNSFSCDLTIAGLQSVPAFLLGRATVGTPLLRQPSLSLYERKIQRFDFRSDPKGETAWWDQGINPYPAISFIFV